MNRKVKMCDLIDLNSPDTKGLPSTRLASPLIPVPTDSAYSNCNTRFNQPTSQTLETRDSLENNPFDMVLHKTTEYIQKKDDPFEVMLEKALRPKSKKNSVLRTCSADFTDDCNLKRKKPSQKSKMNKTLDESLIKDDLYRRKVITNEIPNENITTDFSNTNTLRDDLKADTTNLSFSLNNTNIPAINIQDINSSILSYSVMNDTLFEADEELDIDQMKIALQDKTPICMEEDRININQARPSSPCLKIPKLRRSFSQGDKSPKKLQYLSLTSLVESLRTSTNSGTSTNVSSSSLNFLNTGFRKSQSSGSSVFSSLSNVSSIPKLPSVSSVTSSSIMLSNDTINRTFLESCSSENSNNANYSGKMDSGKKTNTALNKTQCSISDLTDRLNKLKVKASNIRVPEKSENEKTEVVPDSSNECVTVMEKIEECNTDDKLIDVDIFIPEMNASKDYCKSCISNSSSDSVFLEGSKIDRSIFQEARHLARTFEELALKTSSESSTDDFIINNLSWTSELLPAFDDEAIIDNLIELPTSPNTSNANSKNEKVIEHTKSHSSTEKHEQLVTNNVERNKDLEMELLDPIPTEKRITAATLLLDLKKLIETENNVEANKLLENLENVLGINWGSNTELLTTCLSLTNNLAKSPQKSKCSLEIIKNVSENNMEYSQEDNLISNSLESIKESAFGANMEFNSSMNKCISNNQKYLKEINGESENDVSKVKSNTEEINKEKEKNNYDAQNERKKDSCKTENNNFVNERVVLELLANIGKLLAKQTEEHTTSEVLQNLGKVLNSASNSSNVNENAETDNNHVQIQQTPKKSALKVENKTRSLPLSKLTNRFSLDLDLKRQPVSKNSIRRSMSVSQTPPVRSIPSPVMSKGKSTSQLKEVTKHCPSDSEFVNPPSNRKVNTNSDKNNLGKDTQTKSITLNAHKEKATIIGTVKTKLKKKSDSDFVNKRGPMKAILPIGSMQKRETIGKRVIPSIDTVTPPKSHKIISSTPKTGENNSTVNKTSRSSKPVASSTPDAQNSKTRQTQSQIVNCSKKRNISCDISPVTTRVNVNSSNEVNNSPKRISKLSSPKRTTPKRRPTESGIPKSMTPPVNKRLNSSFDVNQYEHFSVSPQRSYKVSKSLKNSPVSLKKNNVQQSPLRESNKIIHKVKPVNLISKLRRHSIGSNVMEKENI